MKILSVFSSIFLCVALFLQQAQATIVPSIPYNLTNGSLADATQVMGNFNTIITDVNANGAHNGVNNDITSITGLTTPLTNAQGGTAFYTGSTSTGSGNAQVLGTVSPLNFSLTAGNIVSGVAGFSNSGPATLNVAGTGVIAMRTPTSSGLAALAGGEVIAGNPYTWYYDGTYLDLLNPTPVPTANAVTGPGSSTNNDVATFNGSTGVVIKDSGFLISSLVRTVKKQVFTSSGTYTPSAGMLYATIICTGAGGGGGGVAGDGTHSASAAGGGSGSTSWLLASAATIGASKAVTIGAQGAAGASGNHAGGTGGDTSVTTLCVGKGGIGGGGMSAASTTAPVPAAGGGTGTGDVMTIGNAGSVAYAQLDNASTGYLAFGGQGGASYWGGAPAQAVGQGSGAVAVAGNAGGTYGAGGGGAAVGNNSSNAAGGAGGAGVVYITEYASQ